MNLPMPSVTTIIITKNEFHNIEDCINSVLWTDEIIIIDSGSTDGTQELCKKIFPKVKLYDMDWPGYGEQKNRAIALATSEWLLFLDADERITVELKEEILQKLNEKEEHISVYKMPRQNYFLGKALRHCCGKDDRRSTRLVKNGCCSFSPDIVHERIITHGRSANMRSCFHHFSYGNLEGLINKMNKYSSLSSIKLIQQNKKSSFAKTLVKASWAFFRIYILRLGFLDGWPGFIIAFSGFEETFYKYAKLVELSKNKQK